MLVLLFLRLFFIVTSVASVLDSLSFFGRSAVSLFRRLDLLSSAIGSWLELLFDGCSLFRGVPGLESTGRGLGLSGCCCCA